MSSYEYVVCSSCGAKYNPGRWDCPLCHSTGVTGEGGVVTEDEDDN